MSSIAPSCRFGFLFAHGAAWRLVHVRVRPFVSLGDTLFACVFVMLMAHLVTMFRLPLHSAIELNLGHDLLACLLYWLWALHCGIELAGGNGMI